MARNKVGRTVGSLSNQLGDYLREQRTASRLSLRQLADQAGVSNPYLSQIERGLRRPSAVRVYFNMALPAEVRGIGHLSERDWQEVQARLALALALPAANAAS